MVPTNSAMRLEPSKIAYTFTLKKKIKYQSYILTARAGFLEV